jgi:hypothetical protein
MGMNKTVKFVLIAVIVLVLLGVGLLAGFVIFLKFTPQGRTMDERLTAMENEGTEFGKTTDQRGCINEGLRRGKKFADITSQVGNRDFVKGCLRSSESTPGFCDGVPSVVRKMFDNWEERQCERIDTPTVACKDVMKEQILFCGVKRPQK